MKFKTRRDLTFKLIFAGLSLLLFILIAESFLFEDFSQTYVYVFDSIIALIWIFIIWIFVDTTYKVTDHNFIYRTGPFFGKIPLQTISKIEVGRTAWSGPKKVALARQGLLMEYKNGKQIYISPKTNKTFIDHITDKNPDIEIKKIKRYIVK